MAPYDISTVATLSCNAGYSLVGKAVRTCVEGAGTGGEWSEGPSNCDGEYYCVVRCIHNNDRSQGAMDFLFQDEPGMQKYDS